MKNISALLVFFFLLIAQAGIAQSKFFDEISSQFRSEKEVNRISIPGAIFKLAGSVESDDQELEIFQFVNQMSLITLPKELVQEYNLNFNKFLKLAEEDEFDEYISVTEEKSLIRLYVKEDRKQIEHVLFLIKSEDDDTVIIDFSCDLPKKKLKQFVKMVREKNLKNGNVNF